MLHGQGSHILIEFVWLCWQHKVYSSYLPLHLSCTLQLLHPDSFAATKSSYQTQVKVLSAFSGTPSIKKERFVSAHNQARNEGLSERITRTGYRATGLCTHILDAVLLFSQVLAGPVPLR